MRHESKLAKIWLWHTLGESSSVRKKKSFGQCLQREGCSSKRASLERQLELMGLKSREEVGSGRTISPPEKVPKLTQPRYVSEEVLVVMRYC
jgi:hypothetical protein